MSRVVGNARFLLAVLAAALFLPNLARAEEPPVTLVDPNWQQQTDAQGVAWMINPQSMLMVNGGQSMFMQAGILTVNGGQYSPQRQQMTPDGHEYVFENATNNVVTPGFNPYGGPVYGALAPSRSGPCKPLAASSSIWPPPRCGSWSRSRTQRAPRSRSVFRPTAPCGR